jgi:type I restriction enzyme S subunit
MASEWTSIKLGDVCTKIGSGATPRGGSEVYLETGPYALIRSQNIYNDGFRHEGLAYISDKHASELDGVEVKQNDVLLNITGDSVARACQVDPGVLPARVNQHVAIIRPDPEKLDPRFLRYVLVSPEMQAKLLSWAGAGGTRNALTKAMIESLEVLAPKDIGEQRAIAHILGTLDDKIELNRRMSETLEAMARALFKSWFVDFDPVRAKAEGRDPGLPQPLADLFPDSFEDSELGEIPKGWEAGRLGQALGELVSGARPKGGAAQEGVPSVGAENVIGLGRYDFSKEKYVPRDFFNELQRKGAAVRPGDVLLYKDGAQIGRKTYFDSGFPHEQCAVNEHVFIVRAKHAQYQRYLFFWLDQDWMTQEIISLNSNSAQPGINQQGVRGLPLLIPPDSVVEAFDHVSKAPTDRLFAACLENRTLAALRDALLPRLICGEIRVKDAERFTSATRDPDPKRG